MTAGQPGEQPLLIDGFFLAPDHAENRAFLQKAGRQAVDQPTPLAVVLEPVDGREFFSPLPGWELAETLARSEGAQRALATLEGADRYYRLGAGVRGALLAQHQSIFDDEPPPIDVATELRQLQQLRGLRSVDQLVAYLDRVMSARTELKKSLNRLGRSVFPFVAYRVVLKSVGIVLPDRAEAPLEHRRWSSPYTAVQRELAARVADEGRALRACGLSDAEALAALTARGPELAREVATRAHELIELELRQTGPRRPAPDVAPADLP
jgi:hypothetical protein